jgi:methylated-DNA-[protein]-cysteine S-methyltransferase
MFGEMTFETSWGPCRIGWTARGVCSFRLPPANGTHTGVAPPFVHAATRLVREYFDGAKVDLSVVALDLGDLPPFRARVYEALRRIPRGRVLDYGELASAAGSPGAARAVGQAMAHNPTALFIPCHRVVAASGHLGGFSAPGGQTTKRRLLDLEATPLVLRPITHSPTKRKLLELHP